MIREETKDRAVSITTGFILNVGIATLAVSLILFSLQGLFADIREDSQETEISVAGERVVWELEKADRMARIHDADGRTFIKSDDVGSYRIRISQENVTVNSPNANVVLEHDVESDIVNAPVEVSGGQSHVVEFDGSNNELEIE